MKILLTILILYSNISLAVPANCNTLLVNWSKATNSHNKTKAHTIFKMILKECLKPIKHKDIIKPHKKR